MLTRNFKSVLAGATALVSIFGSAALAEGTAKTNDTTAAPSTKTSAALGDNAYVTLSGTVAKITDGDEFTLNYSGGTIKVDTNDKWPTMFKKDAAEMLNPGDRVTVTGTVDDNLFTKKEIDATSVRHQGRDLTRIYGQAEYNDQNYTYSPYYSANSDEDEIRVSGQVTKVVDADEFEIKYGTGSLRVNTDDVLFPTAENLRVGDRVTVYGEMDDKWFGKRELEADSVVRTSVYNSRG